jgi:hypothetical protein
MSFVAIGSAAPSASFPPLSWTGWGTESAVGIGPAWLTGQTASGAPVETEPVSAQVTMSGITECYGAKIYTSFAVSLAAGGSQPTDWNFDQAEQGGHETCWTNGGCPEGESSCVDEEYPSHGTYIRRVRGKLELERSPFSGKTYTYDAHVTGSGTAVTVVRALMNSPTKLGGCNFRLPGCEPIVYPVRYTLRRPAWCSGVVLGGGLGVLRGAQYTETTVEAFGNGRPLVGSFFPVAGSEYRGYSTRYGGLLSEIGSPGVSRRVVKSSDFNLVNRNGQPVSAGCTSS